MTERARRAHSAAFKAKVTLVADKTLARLAQSHDTHPNQITNWKNQLQNLAADVLGGEARLEGRGADMEDRHAKIGQLALKNVFFGTRARQGEHAEHKATVDRDHTLPVKQQAELVNINYSAVYCTSQPVSESELAPMRRIDELHLEMPLAGARIPRDLGDPQGTMVCRKRVTRLMRRVAITMLHRKPNTSKQQPGRETYSYLLRSLAIRREKQVWAKGISDIPMARGYVYLCRGHPIGSAGACRSLNPQDPLENCRFMFRQRPVEWTTCFRDMSCSMI